MHNKTHLGLKGETMPLTCLIAGDPQRVKRMCSLWDSPRTVADNRGYLCVAGRYRGIELAACCTGIGGPSCEIAVVELAQHGVRNIIRVGTCGGLDAAVEPGDLAILSGAVRYSGAADAYAPVNYPAVSDWEYVAALVQACKARGFRWHVGVGLSVDAFYATKPQLIAVEAPKTEFADMVRRWAGTGVLGMEMEGAALMVIGSVLRLRTATICTVGSDLPKGVRPDPAPDDENAILAACDAAVVMQGAADGNRE